MPMKTFIIAEILFSQATFEDLERQINDLLRKGYKLRGPLLLSNYRAVQVLVKSGGLEGEVHA